MMENQVIAVVVTYNRWELLQENVAALQQQQYPCDVVVVDNASTDGTTENLKVLLQDLGFQWQQDHYQKEKQRVYIQTLEQNLGGAGGFSYGMKFAVEHGYQDVWIMDDDTIPKPDTLQQLMKVRGEMDTVGFLSSTVEWIDGSPCKMNGQHVIRDDEGICQVDAATFVSLLFPRTVILEMGLPIKEYFIWGDDKEYTGRIAKKYPCYWVKSSVVVHKMKVNAGSNITEDELSKVPRYFYAYRNDYVTARRRGLGALLIYQLAFYLNIYRVLRHAKGGKKERIEVMKKGRSAGRIFDPEIEYIR